MTREDSIKLLALIKVAYPSSYKDMDNVSLDATVNMWHTSFPDVPYVLMEIAFNNFRMQSKFPPTIAEFCEELRGLYWTACGNILNPFLSDVEVKKCRYIIDNTYQYQTIRKGIQINYSAISNDLLNTTENKLLKEG